MFVRKFLAWAATAPAAERAPAAASLARALLDGDLPKDEEYEAGVALAVLADDSSPLVRRAIALEIADRADAPRQIIVALAADQPDVSIPVLKSSPALGDADLIDAAIIGGDAIHAAIAQRARLSASVCAALMEIAAADNVVALVDNAGADNPPTALLRAFERFPQDVNVREALLARADLEPALRARLVQATAASLHSFVVNCGWMGGERAARVTREAQESSFVIVAGSAATEAAGEGAHAGVVRFLRESGQLTTALLLRALLSGERGLFDAALADLAGIGRDRAVGLINNPDGGGFAALFTRAGLPEALLPVFRFSLAALAKGPAQDEFADGGVQRSLVERVLERCEKAESAGGAPVLGLLRRLHAEAARQEAREFSAWLARAQVMGPLDSSASPVSASAVTGQLDPARRKTGQSAAEIGQIAVARALNLAA
jgi:uncharacterized protein (DUF2336 family)